MDSVSEIPRGLLSVTLASAFDTDYRKNRFIKKRLDALYNQCLLQNNNRSIASYEFEFVRKEIEYFTSVINNYLILHTLFTKYIGFGTIEDHWLRFSSKSFIVPHKRKSKLITSFLGQLTHGQRLMRKNDLAWRLKDELSDAVKNNKFIFMNTLTVSNEHYNTVFAKESSAFSKFIQRIDLFLGGKENHSYFAVVEIGASKGRLHIHIIHMFSLLPVSFSDPNKGVTIPSRRIVEKFRSFWRFGFSAPLACRFSSRDVFARKGWVWPVFEIDGKFRPIKGGSVGQLVGYLTKYIMKSHAIKGGTGLWRTRMRRGLGLTRLAEVMTLLSPLQLTRLLLIVDRGQIMLEGKEIPKRLLLKLTQKEIQSRLKSIGKNESRLFLESIPVRTSIVKLFVDMTLTSWKSNSQNIINSEIKNLMNMGFSDILIIFKSIFDNVNIICFNINGSTIRR